MTRASSSRRARAAILARGAVVLASLGSLAAVGAPACRDLIGADEEEYEQVTEHMCVCWKEIPHSFKTEGECQEVLGKRLNEAPPNTTATWLENYVASCKDKGCGSVSDCYYMLPVCSVGECSEAAECCGFRVGEVCSDAGRCEDPDAGGGGT